KRLISTAWNRDWKSDPNTPKGAPPTVEVAGWDADTGTQLYAFKSRAPICQLAFDPEGTNCAGARMDGSLLVWNAAGVTEPRSVVGPSESATCVAFSPDGRQLASASYDGSGILWDATTWKPVGGFHGPLSLNTICYSPDGRRLVGASRDMAMLWDTTTGQEV